MSNLPDYAAALQQALANVAPLSRTEQVQLSHAGQRILAEVMAADRDLPSFDRQQLDGYELRARKYSPDRSWRVAGLVPAGADAVVRVPPGLCVAIATVAP